MVLAYLCGIVPENESVEAAGQVFVFRQVEDVGIGMVARMVDELVQHN